MVQNSEQNKTGNTAQNERKPNEKAGFHFSSSIKITDPENGKVLLQKRAD